MTVLLVFLGGMLGTGGRLGLDALVPHPDTGFPLSTLLINVVGSLALGFLVAGVWPTASARLRAAIGPGVLGSFTTFSAVVVSLTTLTADGQELLALLYLVLSLLLGLGAAATGLALGARFAQRGAAESAL